MVRPSTLTLPFQGSPVGTVSSPLPSKLSLTTRGSLPRGASYLAAAAALGQLGPSLPGRGGGSFTLDTPSSPAPFLASSDAPPPPGAAAALLPSALPVVSPKGGWGAGGEKDGLHAHTLRWGLLLFCSLLFILQ